MPTDFRKRRAFTLLEIVLLVGILFLFVLLLIPAFHKEQPIQLTPEAAPAPEGTPAAEATPAPAVLLPTEPKAVPLPASAPAAPAPEPDSAAPAPTEEK